MTTTPGTTGLTFEALFEAAPDALLAVGRDGVIRLANRRAVEVFGYGVDELVGQSVELVVPGQLREVHVRERSAYQRNPRARPMGVGLRLTGVRRNGDEFPVEVSLSPVDTDDGGVVICAVRDVTEHRRAEQLGARARQHEAVANVAQAALLEDDVPALLDLAVREVAGVLDVPLAEVLEVLPGGDSLRVVAGVGWQDGVVGEATVPALDSQAGHVLESGDAVIVEDLRREQRFRGTPLLHDHGVISGVQVALWARNRIYGVLGAHARERRAFTSDDAHFLRAVAYVLAAALERRRNADLAGVTSQRLQAILDHAPTIICLKDLDGRYLLANRRFEEVQGVRPGAAIGRTDIELYPEDVAQEIRAHDLEVIEAGRPLLMEERVQHDGQERTYSSMKFPLRGSDGQPFGVGVISTDITERTLAEAREQQLEAQLQRAQRLESVGELAGGIAHDFNNLLAVIGNFAGFVAEELPEGSQAHDDVDQILEATRRASELTRRLLLFSRRQVGHPEIVEVNAIVVEIEKLLRRTLGTHIELQASLDPDLPAVHAGRGMLEQVLMNLAINARDAMPDGGTLVVDTKALQLPREFGVQRGVPGLHGDVVRLAVSDTGCGMTEDVVARAFEPFFTTKRAEHGTGLGLASVYGIVTQAGGHVDIYSEPGRGTTIKVYLPAVGGRPEAPVESGRAKPPQGHGETILLVEDKDAVRASTRRILEQAGYRVLEAADGDEALRVAATADELDLLLSDVVMPGMSGRLVAERVLALRPGTGAVLMSGFTDEQLEAGDGAGGGPGFLEKPFSPDRLLAVTRRALDARDSD